MKLTDFICSLSKKNGRHKLEKAFSFLNDKGVEKTPATLVYALIHLYEKKWKETDVPFDFIIKNPDIACHLITEFEHVQNDKDSEKLIKFTLNTQSSVKKNTNEIIEKINNIKNDNSLKDNEKIVEEIKNLERDVKNLEKVIDLELSQLKASIEKAIITSETDALSGLRNRRSFEKEIRRLENNLKSSKIKTASIALIDIDNFKKINDTHGHVVGDSAIKKIASYLERISNEKIKVFRYGGEEFAVISCLSCKELFEEVEQIRKELNRKFFTVKNSNVSLNITFSAGVSRFDANIKKEDAIIQADKLLYTAKETGKNKVLAQC